MYIPDEYTQFPQLVHTTQLALQLSCNFSIDIRQLMST